MNRMSRRAFAGGALLLPIAGLTLREATAISQSASKTATPGASPTASPAASPMASPAAAIVVEARDIMYDKTEITIPAGKDTTITLVNKGVLEHDLVIESLKLSIPLLKPGQEGSIVVNAPAGEYEYWCTVAGHKESGMLGKLIVK